jgi:hypothetical protein
MFILSEIILSDYLIPIVEERSGAFGQYMNGFIVVRLSFQQIGIISIG